MALPTPTNLYAVTDPAASGGLLYIAADPVTVGAQAGVVPWARAVSLPADIADLTTLITNRIPLLSSDAQSRANFGGSLLGLVNPAGNVDAQRALASTGGGLGVAAVGGASYASSSTTAGGAISTSITTATTIFSSTEVAAKRRALIVGSSLTQTVSFQIFLQSGVAGSPANAAVWVAYVVLAAGSSVNQFALITSAGVLPLGPSGSASLSTAPSVVGSVAGLDAPANAIVVKAFLGAAATGNAFVDYLALT